MFRLGHRMGAPAFHPPDLFPRKAFAKDILAHQRLFGGMHIGLCLDLVPEIAQHLHGALVCDMRTRRVGQPGIAVDDHVLDTGLDGLQALQPTCKGMVPEDLKAEFGGKILLMGAVDTQLLIEGTPEQARDETRRIIDIMKPRGGYVCSPSHDFLLPETPLENIVAHYQAIRDYGSY